MRNKLAGVYRISCGDRFYIGSSVDIRARFSNHRSRLRHGKHTNSFLQAVWDKYGEDAFSFNVLVVTERNQTRSIEQRLLNRVVEDSDCMNIGKDARGAMAGRRHSEATRTKIAEAHRGKSKPTLSEEHKIELSRIRKGQGKSKEHKEKIRAALKGRKLSDAARKKMSAAKKGRKHDPEVVKRRNAAIKASWARRKTAANVYPFNIPE